MASTNPYSLIFEYRDGYLYSCVTADSIDRKAAISYLTEISDRLKSSRSKRLLLDRRIPKMLSDGDLFTTTLDFLEMIRGTKVAFVNPYLSIDEAMTFAMTIGNNRGANYQLFADADAAERWLLS